MLPFLNNSSFFCCEMFFELKALLAFQGEAKSYRQICIFYLDLK